MSEVVKITLQEGAAVPSFESRGAAGADVLVAGSAVFAAPDQEEAIRSLKRL